MNILILGDIIGLTGREAIKLNLKDIIKENKINFTVVNGENAANDGFGITKNDALELFEAGTDVITSGNHIWDKSETVDFIQKDTRLLRPANLANGSPGKGFEIYSSKNKKYKIAVINLMGNVFMRKTEDVFIAAKKIQEKIVLKKNADFITKKRGGDGAVYEAVMHLIKKFKLKDK